MAKGRPKQTCPNCGKEFQPEWGSGERMPDVRHPADGQAPGREILQPVLLSAGDGSEPCGGKVRMVRGNVYGYQRAGAAVLQLAVCGIRAIQPTEGTTRTAEAQRGQSGGVEGAAGTGGACQPIQKTWEADMAGMRDDEYVHGTGWADGHRAVSIVLESIPSMAQSNSERVLISPICCAFPYVISYLVKVL